MLKSEIDGALNELFDSIDGINSKEYKSLLSRAQELAKKCGIYAQDKGSGSLYTIEAALKVAIEVWQVEASRKTQT
jgi:hypothetical protein